MSDASNAQFRTYQKPGTYESSLGRHKQWVRWMQGLKCPCVREDTGQPDPTCTQCKGRGRMYFTPDTFSILNQACYHDNQGKIYPPFVPVIAGSVRAMLSGVELPLSGTQPSDGSYVQLEAPYPKPYQEVLVSYDFTQNISVTAENSDIYGTNTLRVIAARFYENGKAFEGSIVSVSRVYNATKDETYTVTEAIKEYIYLSAMGTWESGDTMEVDYTYVNPFAFMLNGVTPRLRYEQPYVLEEADAVMVTPYWAQVAPDDLITAMAQEQIGQAVINPKVTSGNDQIIAYYDLSKLLRVIDTGGRSYTVGPGKEVEIYGRNELKWNITKPVLKFTVQFTYHPTYSAISNLHTLRNAENKAFVNRVSVRLFDHVHERITY